ncbi:MAG: pantetheine-phosphate adenylyltransferase [Myxococcales bacterium]|nr:pantetheine-phosphate adenylyltransferase [Myxococcales bacterium]
MSSTLAVYAGSFDPITLGHLDLIRRAVRLFPRVVVAIGRHPTRHPLFQIDQRLEFLRGATNGMPTVEIAAFDGLLIHYCSRIGATILIRGLRHSMDFEYELQIAQANADMAPEVETVFFPTASKYGFVTASLVREIASHGGDVSRYVPPIVLAALADKFPPA